MKSINVGILWCVSSSYFFILLVFQMVLNMPSLRTDQENQKGLKLNVILQVLAYANDVNLLGKCIIAIQKSMKCLP
jgi:hypothetical protein